MSLLASVRLAVVVRFPRVSGDEPLVSQTTPGTHGFSPRERG